MNNNITIDLDEYDELKDIEFKYEFIVKWLKETLYYNEHSDKLSFEFRDDDEFISIMKMLDYRIRNSEDYKRKEFEEERYEEYEDRDKNFD